MVLTESSCWLPYSRRAPGSARRLLRELLAGTAGGEQYADTGELLLSELVTNAIVHGRAAGRLMWVRLELAGGSLRIEVHDASADRPVPRRARVGEESGRGMQVVNSLAERWGCCPRAGGVGKMVWCTIAPASGGAE